MIELAETHIFEPRALQEHEGTPIAKHSLSVILPAYNEAQVIASTVTTVRKVLSAWGWRLLIGWVLGVHVRDVDCAFKLLRTAFLRQHPLETRGAMINAELLYTLTQAGGTYKELGVHHLPRQAGRATGAKLSVILRAFHELFTYSYKWQRVEQQRAKPLQALHTP